MQNESNSISSLRWITVLVLLAIAEIKYSDKINLEEKRFIWLTIPGHSFILGSSRQQELEAMSHTSHWQPGTENNELIHSGAELNFAILIQSRNPCLGDGNAQSGSSMPINTIKTISNSHWHFFQVILDYFKWTMKTNHSKLPRVYKRLISLNSL